MITWKECEKKFIRKVTPDKSQIQSLLEKAHARRKIIENITLNTETVSFIVEGYYEIIKELLIAYLLKNGMRSRNHICLLNFFAIKHPTKEQYIHLLYRLLEYRNKLNYYGESVPLNYFIDNKEQILHLIEYLKEITA